MENIGKIDIEYIMNRLSDKRMEDFLRECNKKEIKSISLEVEYYGSEQGFKDGMRLLPR